MQLDSVADSHMDLFYSTEDLPSKLSSIQSSIKTSNSIVSSLFDSVGSNRPKVTFDIHGKPKPPPYNHLISPSTDSLCNNSP